MESEGKAEAGDWKRGRSHSISAVETSGLLSFTERRVIVHAFDAFKTLLQSFAKFIFLSGLVTSPIEVHKFSFGDVVEFG